MKSISINLKVLQSNKKSDHILKKIKKSYFSYIYFFIFSKNYIFIYIYIENHKYISSGGAKSSLNSI